MNISRLVALVSFSGLWLGACGGTTASSSAPVAETDFAQTYANILCGAKSHCCSQHGISSDQAACIASTKSMIQTTVVDLATKANGAYDAAAAGTCLDALKTDFASCGEGSAFDDTTQNACARVFKGPKAPGQACASSLECAPPESGSVSCDGVFQSDGSSSASVCRVHVTPKGGEPCGGAIASDATTIAACDFGEDPSFTCDSSTSKCTARRDAGGACVSTSDCKRDLQCASGNCAPLLAVGATCSPAQYACDTSSHCDSATLKCVAKLADGSACTDGQACVGGACADGKCTSILFGDAKSCSTN